LLRLSYALARSAKYFTTALGVQYLFELLHYIYISLNSKILKIYDIENELIATHERPKGKGVFSTNTAHYDKYKVLCPGFEQHDALYEDKMSNIGNHSDAFYLEVKEKHKQNWYRVIDLLHNPNFPIPNYKFHISN
jgi:hypothetical protein